ncbi:hypothetical protein Misp01_70710 [Microtetraspora sp. NBRC 13810]|nr:hypothetical protein Misp01_70710 [Microtetraspora sp. NBRC 13810]
MRPESPDAAAARAALNDVTAARARVLRHVTRPWWYHYGLGAAVILFFFSISFRFASFGAPIMALTVLGLAAAHKRATGVVFSTTGTMGAKRTLLFVGVILALIGTAMYLEYGRDVVGAHAVAGVVIGVLIVVASYRTDAAIRRELRADHDQAGL